MSVDPKNASRPAVSEKALQGQVVELARLWLAGDRGGSDAEMKGGRGVLSLNDHDPMNEDDLPKGEE